ncbi:MAG TPA: tyrosine--tRNA ligase [Candidatus Nanoarchaeia archaeon]|nr:tyrosine--tRNA ligase [Candidatus Nanoarchaeia archaeon]
MDIDKRIEVIKQVGEEIITEEDLRTLLSEKKNPIAYDGFEPSGTDIHIAQGLLRAININKMTAAGCKFKILVADWHAWANNKLGGDLEKIQKAGQFYIKIWKACGLDEKNIEFVWANDIIKNPSYWKIVMQVSRNSTLKRIIRCGQIMGRKEDEVMQASQILYPCMQCADIFYLGVDICSLGQDQRKVNVLAMELAQRLGFKKPVAVHHHMLMGLGQPPKTGLSGVERGVELKMSKSKPDTAIFMLDSEQEIARKIRKAWCPEGIVDQNPILEYFKYIIFEKFDLIIIERPEKYGGSLEFSSYKDLEEGYSKKNIHPMDLKETVSKYLNKLIAPVREAIFSNPESKKLYEEVQGFKVTR